MFMNIFEVVGMHGESVHGESVHGESVHGEGVHGGRTEEYDGGELM